MNSDFIEISVLVLTLDEEVNLPQCLGSLTWCDDIVVLDSESTDRTVEIAESFGAKVFKRQFDNYAAQRNFGINDIEYKNQWILMVDADEEIPQDLADEMSTVIQSGESGVCLYRMRRKDFFMNKWIKRSSGYPTWFGRLVKVGHVTVERAINEEYLTTGEIGFLENHLHHYPFNKGFASWFEKHNRYSSMEAELIFSGGLAKPTPSDFMSREPTTRRKAIKNILYRLPFRPLLVFLILYIFRGGIFDGRAGLTFCLLRSHYEFMINCKVREKTLRDLGLPL